MSGSASRRRRSRIIAGSLRMANHFFGLEISSHGDDEVGETNLLVTLWTSCGRTPHPNRLFGWDLEGITACFLPGVANIKQFEDA